jgi:succinate dehydrogenase/fumarate reductase flavoprotein subunit
MKYKIIKGFDVVVVGMGAAGLRAAIASHDQGARTAVITMGDNSPTQCGATTTAEYSYSAPLGIADSKDNADVFFDDISRAGLSVNNPQLGRLLAEQAAPRLLEMHSWGVRFDLEPDGTLQQNWLAGHSYPRAVHFDYSTGREMARGLHRHVIAKGIQVLPYRFALDLVVENGRVSGVLVLNIAQDRLEIITGSAVVLATGGASGVWDLNSNPPGIDGDGMAMALRAGVELIDMEFEQFFPACLVAPPSVRGTNFPFFSRGVLLNCKGKAFLKNYGLEEGRDVRDVLAIAICKEIEAGRDTPNGGVLVDFRRTPPEILEDLTKNSKIRYLHDLGFEPLEDQMEIAPSAHFTMGGIRIDADAKTTIPGLYACGEVCGGCHGANRLAGNALAETQVFGNIAGASAAEYANSDPLGDSGPNADVVETLIGAVFSRRGTKDISEAIDDIKQIRDIMERNVKVIRDEDSLNNARIRLAELSEKAFAFDEPFGDEAFNYMKVEALKQRNMALVARAVVESALHRDESRGAHYRQDHPRKRNVWDSYNVVVRLDSASGELTTYRRPGNR